MNEWNGLYREWEQIVLYHAQDEAGLESALSRLVERWNGADGVVTLSDGVWATVSMRAIALWEPEPRLGEPIVEVWATEAARIPETVVA